MSECEQNQIDHEKIGSLLTEHHKILRDILHVSTPKIDSMIEVALAAGTLGGKINGSGGGGCMFAYAPKHPERVADAIKSVREKAMITQSDDGTRKI